VVLEVAAFFYFCGHVVLQILGWSENFHIAADVLNTLQQKSYRSLITIFCLKHALMSALNLSKFLYARR